MWDLWATCRTSFKPKDQPRVWSVEWGAFIAAKLDGHPAFEVSGEALRAVRMIAEVLNAPPERRETLMD